MLAENADRRDFFISHAGADLQWAEWIGQQLSNAGYTVELDVWAWAAGMDFVDAMESALERADRVLAVYTRSYFTRPYARAEHRAAFTAAVTGRPGHIVPVRVEDCEVPQLYASLIRIELTGLGEAEAARQLLAGVAGPAGLPTSPIGFPGVRAPGSAPIGGLPVEVGFPRRMPPVWNVPARNLFFTGRSHILDTIGRRLQQVVVRSNGPVAVVPVQGMGGVGKTQLAVEYAHRHASDYQVIWWINQVELVEIGS